MTDLASQFEALAKAATQGECVAKTAPAPIDGEHDCGIFIPSVAPRNPIAETFGRVDADVRQDAAANADFIAFCFNNRTLILSALRAGDGWQDIETAPKDGTRILIRFEHENYKYASDPEDQARWEEVCIAHWIDHNGGGWTWNGIYGRATVWRPLPPAPEPAGGVG